MYVSGHLLFRTVLEGLFICCIAALYLSILGGVKTLLNFFICVCKLYLLLFHFSLIIFFSHCEPYTSDFGEGIDCNDHGDGLVGFLLLCVIISGSKTFSKLSRNSNPGSNNNIALPWISFVQDYHHRFWRLAATREPIMIAMERRTRCSPDLSLKTWIIQMKMPSQIEYSLGPTIGRFKILW